MQKIIIPLFQQMLVEHVCLFATLPQLLELLEIL